ncbi:MAG: PspA/IM30 family protein [Planctomycetes bacterium]|nr:PspA/IM30 family protein [Planctomycetota bacterium]
MSLLARVGNLFKGFASLFVSGIERRNPEALLEVEKENLRKQIGQFNTGLASHAGMCEKLMSQVRKLEVDERDLRAKAAAHLKAGNRAAAGQYALRLQTVTRELEENRRQLTDAERTYKELVKARDVSVAQAKAKIEQLKSSIDDMKMKKAMAELNEMASGMITTMGGSGDTLNRLQEMVEDERNKAAGRARLARDSLNTDEFKIKEAEQEALADQALADFAAKEGISIPGGAAAAAPVAETPAADPAAVPAQPQKTMG